VVTESLYVDDDDGGSENVFKLSPEELKNRRVVMIDIGADETPNQPPEREPRSFVSEITGKGPLVGDWIKTSKPIMCCYKLVTIKFAIFGLQGRIEEAIARVSFIFSSFSIGIVNPTL